MKRIFFPLLIIGAILTGCNPMEDIYNDIDAQEDPIVGTDEFTMTTEDYAAIVDQGSDEDPDFYEMFEAFSDIEDAKTMLPAFISNKYPLWGEGSSVTVNFNLYDGNPEDVSALVGADVYFLSSTDYPTSNSNAFLMEEDVEASLENVLATQYPTPTEGQVVRLGYNKFTETPEVGLASVFEAAFPANFGDFDLIEVFDDGLTGAADNLGWRDQSSFAEGSGYSGGANTTEEWLISSEIDLTSSTGLSFQITQEIDFLGDSTLFDVMVSTDYTSGNAPSSATWTAVSFDKTAYGDMSTSADIDFSAYDGQTIHIALKYSSTSSDSPRWRVESFAVRTTGFSGATESLSAYYKYFDGSWDSIDNVYYLSNADYDSMGEASGQPGQYNNFSATTIASNYLPQFLSIKFPFAQEGDAIFMIYRYYGGSSVGTITKGNLYTFEGGEWMPNISSLQFGFENGVWVPDNTIRYTLVGADYDAIVSALAATYPDATSSMDNYGNFERRQGNAAEWTDAMVLEALSIVLDNINPSAADGQKYTVTVAIYNGSSGTEDFNVIKSAGEWMYQ